MTHVDSSQHPLSASWIGMMTHWSFAPNSRPIFDKILEVGLTPLGPQWLSADSHQTDLHPVASFNNSVEGFWSLYNNMPRASRLTPKFSYNVFMVG
jgi:hypothetical protein